MVGPGTWLRDKNRGLGHAATRLLGGWGAKRGTVKQLNATLKPFFGFVKSVHLTPVKSASRKKSLTRVNETPLCNPPGPSSESTTSEGPKRKPLGAMIAKQSEKPPAGRRQKGKWVEGGS